MVIVKHKKIKAYKQLIKRETELNKINSLELRKLAYKMGIPPYKLDTYIRVGAFSEEEYEILVKELDLINPGKYFKNITS